MDDRRCRSLGWPHGWPEGTHNAIGCQRFGIYQKDGAGSYEPRRKVRHQPEVASRSERIPAASCIPPSHVSTRSQQPTSPNGHPAATWAEAGIANWPRGASRQSNKSRNLRRTRIGWKQMRRKAGWGVTAQVRLGTAKMLLFVRSDPIRLPDKCSRQAEAGRE